MTALQLAMLSGATITAGLVMLVAGLVPLAALAVALMALRLDRAEAVGTPTPARC